MRILLLSRYTRLGASSRLRTMQYLPALKSAGFDVDVAPFFDDAYLQALYSGEKNTRPLATYMWRRLAEMRAKPAPDVIWLEYEALPWVPWLIENSFLPRDVPVVNDYDDAIFHRYDLHRRSSVRWMLGRKIDRVMRRSQVVMAGNEYLAARAEQAGTRRVEVIPTVVDLDHYDVRPPHVNTSNLNVGWIGTPNTWNTFGEMLYSQIKGTLAAHRARFRAVGADLKESADTVLEVVPWSEDTEVSEIQRMSIGVMPLTDTPWSRGKCGYKLIQYMACGLPVVASPVGVNAQIVEHGINGFLASTDTEWEEALTTLLQDSALRQKMGQAGRRKVEAQYSLEVWAPLVAQLLQDTIAES